MADYAAAPIQPIVQGIVTGVIPAPGVVTTFFGRGVSKITRVGAGQYRMILDAGLPGNAGEIEPLPEPVLGQPIPVGPVAPDARTLVTLRGTTTTVTQALASYAQSSVLVDGVAPPVDGGLNVVEVTLIALAPIDATFEIVVWLGVDSAQL